MSNPTVRVLLFDDDFETMEPLKRYLELERDWYVELTAEQGVLERLRTQRFDLVAVDVMIHKQSLHERQELVDNVHFEGINWGETGLEFLRRLRQGDFSAATGEGTSPDVPVLLLTALPRELLEERLGLLMPPPLFRAKPFRLEDLTEDMTRLVQGVGDGH